MTETEFFEQILGIKEIRVDRVDWQERPLHIYCSSIFKDWRLGTARHSEEGSRLNKGCWPSYAEKSEFSVLEVETSLIAIVPTVLDHMNQEVRVQNRD